MRWIKCLALLLMAALLTGGTFTCRSGDKNNNDDTDVIVTGSF